MSGVGESVVTFFRVLFPVALALSNSGGLTALAPGGVPPAPLPIAPTLNRLSRRKFPTTG
jgi:hypothetical protein